MLTTRTPLLQLAYTVVHVAYSRTSSYLAMRTILLPLVRLCLATRSLLHCLLFFFQAEDGIRDLTVTGVQTCALPMRVHLLDELYRRDLGHPPHEEEGGEDDSEDDGVHHVEDHRQPVAGEEHCHVALRSHSHDVHEMPRLRHVPGDEEQQRRERRHGQVRDGAGEHDE